MSPSATLIILFYIQLLFSHSNALFNCSEPSQCIGQTFGCSTDQDECKLYCGGISSCDGVIFNCNTGTAQKSCDMICDNTNSCENAKFYATSTFQTNLECNGFDSCTQMTMTSNSYGPTYIKCNGQRSCNVFSISIDSNYYAEIECGDFAESCSNLQYSVYGSSTLGNIATLKCLGSNTGCSNVQFHCNFTQGMCSTNCSTSTACDSSSIYCYDMDNICSSNDYISFPIIGNQQQSTSTDAPSVAPTAPSILQNYAYIDNATDWFSAQKYCQEVYESNLATITTMVDFDNINMYSNMSKNRWIGLNNIYQNQWQWIDGSLCNDYVGNNTGTNGMCEDDNNWGNGQPLDINGTCGVMTAAYNGMYSNTNCSNKYSFLCNITPKIDYICARDENSILKRVFEHNTYDQYISNRTLWDESILILSVSNNYWYLRDDNNNTFGECKINGTEFILPTECANWQWMSTNSTLSDIIDLTFSDCSFTGICVGVGSFDPSEYDLFDPSELASPFNTVARQYEFEYFDMEQNGPVYYSPGNELYLYPIIYGSIGSITSRMYIIDYEISNKKAPNIQNVYAYCDTDQSTTNNNAYYVFDIRDCNNNWAMYDKSQSLVITERNIQTVFNCNPTPYPTNAPTLTPQVNYMRYYCYYSAEDPWQETHFNVTSFVETFRNATITAFYHVFTPNYYGYIADFQVCDVFVDYSQSEIVSILNNDNCPFMVPDHGDIPEGPYFAAATFKIYASPTNLISFGDDVITAFSRGDFATSLNIYMKQFWPDLSFETSDKGIYVFNKNDTTTTPSPITTTSITESTTSDTLEITDLIFKCLYSLSNSVSWQTTKLELFAQYLQNATLKALDKEFSSTDGDVINFQICSIFNDKLVNGGDSSCPYDTRSAINSEFSAVAPFQIEYKGSSSFKSNIMNKFEGLSFKNRLAINMNNLLSLSSSRRLLASDFAVVSVDIIDPSEITIIPTSAPSKSADTAEEGDESANHEILDNLFQIAFVIIIAIFAIIIVLAIIHSNCIYINHFFRVSALITVAIHIMDMLSDVFFTINASFGRHDVKILIIFILSGSFILIPILMTLVQLCVQMEKHWLKSDKLRSWLSENTKLLYFVSIITGSSFTAIELFNSNLFSLPQFDMGLTRKELMGYQYKRVYSVVLLENLPQLVLQASYIYVIDGAWGIITATSLTFTIISIIVAVISMFIQKQILFNQDLVMIEFDVTGSSIVAKGDQCRNVIRTLHEQLSTILGLSKGLVEIIRPNNIPNGLRVHLNIHIVDDEKDSDIIDHFENIMNDAIQSGQLQSTFNDCWKLKVIPNITNLSVSTEDSKKKARLNSTDGPNVEMMNKLGTEIKNHELSGNGEGDVDGEEFIEGNNENITVQSENDNLIGIQINDNVNVQHVDDTPIPYKD